MRIGTAKKIGALVTAGVLAGSATVLGAEYRAEAAPTVAAATQEAAASAIGEVVGDAHAGPPVKVGSGFIAGKAAALEHDGVDAGFLQLQRHGDACSAAADDTDLGLNDGARGQFVGVDQHGWFLLGTQCCEGKRLTLKGKCLSSSG